VSVTPGGDWTFLDEVAVNPRLPGPTLRHAALGKRVTLAHAPAPFYGKAGAAGLTDGHVARSADCLNLEWLGVEGKDFDATVDLGRAIELRRVGARFLQQVRVGVRIPGRLDVLVSDDGKAFRQAASVTHKQDERPAYIKVLAADLKGVRARYVRVVGRTNGMWLFADEVFVNPE
jgi:hexosaminidase